MYRSFSPTVMKQMEDKAEIIVTIKAGWTGITKWTYTPAFISYCIGVNREHIFSCYITKENDSIQITTTEPTDIIKFQKSLVDAYMYVAIKGLIKFVDNLGVKILVFDSHVSAAADHMLDLGFTVTTRGIAGSRGSKIIGE